MSEPEAFADQQREWLAENFEEEEPGAPAVNLTFIGHGSQKIGPFNTAGKVSTLPLCLP